MLRPAFSARYFFAAGVPGNTKRITDIKNTFMSVETASKNFNGKLQYL